MRKIIALVVIALVVAFVMATWNADEKTWEAIIADELLMP